MGFTGLSFNMKQKLGTGLGLGLDEVTVGLFPWWDRDGTQGQPSISTQINLAIPETPMHGSVNAFLTIPWKSLISTYNI